MPLNTPNNKQARLKSALIILAALAPLCLDRASGLVAAPRTEPGAHTLQQVSLSPAEVAGLLDQGKSKEAERAVQEILKAKPESAKALRILAQALAQQGQMDKARETLQKAISIDPRADEFDVISPEEAQRLIRSNPVLAEKLLREVQLVRPGDQVERLIGLAQAQQGGAPNTIEVPNGAVAGPGDATDIPARDQDYAANQGLIPLDWQPFAKVTGAVALAYALIVAGVMLIKKRKKQREIQKARDEANTWYLNATRMIDDTKLVVEISAKHPEQYPLAATAHQDLQKLEDEIREDYQSHLQSLGKAGETSLPNIRSIDKLINLHRRRATMTPKDVEWAAKKEQEKAAEQQARQQAAIRARQQEEERARTAKKATQSRGGSAKASSTARNGSSSANQHHHVTVLQQQNVIIQQQSQRSAQERSTQERSTETSKVSRSSASSWDSKNDSVTRSSQSSWSSSSDSSSSSSSSSSDSSASSNSGDW